MKKSSLHRIITEELRRALTEGKIKFSDSDRANAKQGIEFVKAVASQIQDIQNGLEEVEYTDGFTIDFKETVKTTTADPLSLVDDLIDDLDEYITSFGMIETAAKQAQTNLEKAKKMATALQKTAEKMEDEK